MAYVRVDSASDLRSDAFRDAIAAEFNALVEISPGGHHEGVGQAESGHAPLTRRSEAMQRRSKRTAGFTLTARMYAVQVRNQLCTRGSKICRFQTFTGTPPSSKPVLLLFGCEVAILETAASPKGAPDGRASIGTFAGTHGSGYLVIKDNNQRVLRTSVTPTNEHLLMRAGYAKTPPAAQTTPTQRRTPRPALPRAAQYPLPLAPRAVLSRPPHLPKRRSPSYAARHHNISAREPPTRQ